MYAEISRVRFTLFGTVSVAFFRTLSPVLSFATIRRAHAPVR